MERKVILYIAASLDGYIAKPDDDLSFLQKVATPGEDYGYTDFVQNVDTVILGRRTYMWVKQETDEFPHQDKTVFVVTRKQKGTEGNVTYWPGSLRDLVDQLKEEPGANIYCDGGAAVTNEMLRKECLDEIIISTIPIILGNGIRLFHEGIPENDLELISSRSFSSGLVQSLYRVVK